jgi:hypothetical protein
MRPRYGLRPIAQREEMRYAQRLQAASPLGSYQSVDNGDEALVKPYHREGQRAAIGVTT